MNDHQSFVNQVVQSAIDGRGPMEVELPSGGWFVVHPQAEYVTVSVGQFGGVDALELLRRRWLHPDRFGRWIPAAMSNDNPIAVMRLERKANGEVEFFDDALLGSAREFLS